MRSIFFSRDPSCPGTWKGIFYTVFLVYIMVHACNILFDYRTWNGFYRQEVYICNLKYMVDPVKLVLVLHIINNKNKCSVAN